MPEFPRRSFFAGGAATAMTAAATGALMQQAAGDDEAAPRPLAIASGNGLQAVERAMERMRQGADPLDAAIAGVNLVEDDPNDLTVGLGGVPNEAGVVELDSAVMHGPTGNGGAVASLQKIRNPSRVAKLVMERTDHVLLVGEGALQFALAHGFREENLLTDRARKVWLRWKESLSGQDDWLPPSGAADGAADSVASSRRFRRPTGTIHLSALSPRGDLGSVTTTSGLWFKIPGRVGDSPILGAGLYTDNAVGSAGSTGRGEANLLSCASFLIVESMRGGQSPEEACLTACRRIAEQTRLQPRLLNKAGQPDFNVSFYALDKRGRYGSAAIHQGVKFAIHDGKQARLEDAAYLFARPPAPAKPSR